MGIFNFFKSKPKEPTPEQIKAQEEKEAYDNREIRGYCGNCGKIIELDESWTKQVGKHYHRKCWKEMVKSAW
jgi:hypothetical protein